MHKFTGGYNDLTKDFAKKFQYPQQIKESGIQRTVYVRFVVEQDGSISEVDILWFIGSGCDDESICVKKICRLGNPVCNETKLLAYFRT